MDRSAVELTLAGESEVVFESCFPDRSRTIVCGKIAQSLS
jgi:hypothetical protein